MRQGRHELDSTNSRESFHRAQSLVTLKLDAYAIMEDQSASKFVYGLPSCWLLFCGVVGPSCSFLFDEFLSLV